MRPAKSDELHALHGTKPRASVDETTVFGMPQVPSDLQPDEKKVYKRARKILGDRRTLTAGDEYLLTLLACALVKRRRAHEHVATEGEIILVTKLDSNGKPFQVQAKNQWLAIEEKAVAEITSALDRLGLTPMNRSRVKKTTAAEAGHPGVVFLPLTEPKRKAEPFVDAPPMILDPEIDAELEAESNGTG